LKKDLDDLERSLDFPEPSLVCPKGHFLKTNGGDCIFCRNWLKQVNIGYRGVPNKSGPYKRRDIGADYGGSGTLG